MNGSECYTKTPNAVIINNNFLTRFFKVAKGVRQKDPLSPTIYVLCIEHLALMLRQSTLYKGFVIEKHCFTIFSFADDTVIYLNGNQ